MINLGEYSGENVVYFKSFNFDFDYKGVTHIRGINRNSRLKGRNNGAGKSLFAAGLSELICDTQPVQTKGDARAMNDMFSDGTLLNLEVNGSSIVKAMRKGKIEYRITTEEDGNLGKMTNTKAKQVIDELFPITEEAFYTYFHLDSRRQFPLQTQNSATRIDTFCSLFDLDGFDLMKEYFDEKLSSIKTVLTRYEVMKKSLAALGGIENVVEVEAKFSDVQSRLSAVREEIETLRNKVADPKAERRKAKAVELLEYFNLTPDQEGSDRFTRGYHSLRKRLSGSRGEALAFQQYKKALERFSHLKLDREVPETAKELKDTIEVLREEIEELDTEIANLKVAVKAQEKLDTVYREVQTARKRLVKALALEKGQSSEDVYQSVTGLRSTFRSRLEVVKRSIKNLKNAEGSCDVCGNVITKSHKESHLQELNAELVSLTEGLAVIESVEEDIVDLAQWSTVVEFDPDAEPAAALAKVQTRRSRILSHVKDAEDKLEIRRALDQIAELGNPEKPSRTEDEVEESLENASALYSLLPDVVWSLKSNSKSSERYKTLQETESTLENSLQRLRARIEVAVHKNGEAERLNLEMNTMRDEAERAPAYKLLQQAYGTKGIKSLAVARVAKRVEHCINQMSSSCLPEPIEFEFDVGLDKFNIIAHRMGDRISDVRRLSGSESLCFNMMMAASIIQLLPTTQRCNTIILDEMVSHVDPVSVPLIYNQFIPLLNSIVPHVVLLDIGTEAIPGAREYAVVKKGDESRLLEVDV